MSKEQVEGKGEECEEQVGGAEQEMCEGKEESVEQENGGQNSMCEVKGR